MKDVQEISKNIEANEANGFYESAFMAESFLLFFYCSLPEPPYINIAIKIGYCVYFVEWHVLLHHGLSIDAIYRAEAGLRKRLIDFLEVAVWRMALMRWKV